MCTVLNQGAKRSMLTLLGMVVFILVHATADHECSRPCLKGQLAKDCRYTFTLQAYTTFSKSACGACPHNETACLQSGCVTAGGGVSHALLLSINLQLPGPEIEVCEGDTVSVEVHNRLPGGAEVTLHWHGVRQVNTPHMDGVPMVTQCPIQSGSSFRYRFLASDPGTHFYHAHSVLQQADGLYGALVVKPLQSPPPEGETSPTSHVILLSAWNDLLLSGAYGTVQGELVGSSVPSMLLINGRGIIKNSTEPTKHLVRFSLLPGRTALLRVINAAALDCPVRVTMESHVLRVVRIQSASVRPVLVREITAFPGERYDLEVDGYQPSGTYILRVQGDHLCSTTPPQEAAMTYVTSEGAISPSYSASSEPVYDLMTSDCTHEKTFSSILCSADLEALSPPTLIPTPSVFFTLPFGFDPVELVKEEDLEFRFVLDDIAYYPTFLMSDEGKHLAPHLNHVTFRSPSSPLLTQPEDAAKERGQCESTPGTSGTVAGKSLAHVSSPANRPRATCRPAPHYCGCTHLLRVPLHAKVQITLTHQKVTEEDDSPAHTFHLHGHRFQVISWRGQGEEHHVASPTLRDTVTVPQGGSVTLNFISSNPGYWLLESRAGHVTTAGVGVAAILQVGERDQLPPLPEDFPRCSAMRQDDVIF